MNAPLSQRPPRKFKAGKSSRVESLEDLIVAGDVKGVANYLDRDPNAATRPLRGTPPLLLAVALEQEEIVELLVARGVDLLVEDDRQRMAVHVAAEKCHAGVMSVLLRAMTKKNKKHTFMVLSSPQANGRKPIFSASKDEDTLQIIIDSANSLAEALGKGRKESMQAIGINDCHTETGLCPMHVAAASGNVGAVKALITAGADLSPIARAPNNSAAGGSVGMTPLMLACQEGCIDVARIILSSSASSSNGVLEVVTEDGVSALHLASMMGHPELYDLLVECGADPDILDSNGKRASDYLCTMDEQKAASVETSFKSEASIVSSHKNEGKDTSTRAFSAGEPQSALSGGALVETVCAPISHMEMNSDVRNTSSVESSPILQSGNELGGEANVHSNGTGMQLRYLDEPIRNPTLAYLIPHVEKALVSLSKKYEDVALSEFEGDAEASRLVEHHPKDALATYMLRHKFDPTLPQIAALKKK
eukprot:g2760.t1